MHLSLSNINYVSTVYIQFNKDIPNKSKDIPIYSRYSLNHSHTYLFKWIRLFKLLMVTFKHWLMLRHYLKERQIFTIKKLIQIQKGSMQIPPCPPNNHSGLPKNIKEPFLTTKKNGSYNEKGSRYNPLPYKEPSSSKKDSTNENCSFRKESCWNPFSKSVHFSQTLAISVWHWSCVPCSFC